MKKKLNIVDLFISGNKQSVSLRSFKFPFAPLQVVICAVLTLVLLEIILLGSMSPTGPGVTPLGQAAVATRPALLNNNLSVSLPETKEEARQFERLHASPFNFDYLSRLRQERAVFSSGQAAARSNQAAPVTPRPTGVAGLVEKAILAAPFTPAAGCGTTPVPPDGFEPDDDITQAKPISPGSVPGQPRQTRNLLSVSSGGPPDPATGSGDVDWFSFKISSLSFYYIIETGGFNPSSVDTIIELYREVTGNPPVLINSSDTTGGPDRIVYTPATGDTAADVTFYVRVYGAPGRSCIGTYQLSVGTSTSLSSLTPTATAIPSVTGTATPSTCLDAYEDDGVPSRARELRVSFTGVPAFGGTPGAPDTPGANNNVQQHFICPVGDVDWVYVDLVKGKPYSIYTTALTGGLDTIMVLYEKDAQGNLNALYSSDDFPGMGLASRIDFVVPATPTTATGEFVRYYVAVKDVTGKGAQLLSYNLVLASVGSGQNDCIDYYEPDGLQYTAKEILVNEVQSRVICPDGDADWVKFYAKTGRTYTLRTDFGPTPGLDTTLGVYSVVFDPIDPTQVVSQRQIAFNDDQSPTELNSRVDFSVPVDGIYYAQIKGNGDIGRPGFYYRLTYSVAGAGVAAPGATATPTANAAGTATAAVTLTARAIASRTATATGAASSVTLSLNFADPAFQRLWYYTDLVVVRNQAQRSWEWGPRPGVVMQEAYADSPGGQRQVQYFDKSRMEINNPKGDRNSPWFVSNGLLVREMVSGQIAQGDKQVEQRSPASIPVAGDNNPANFSPTYARFAALITDGDYNRATNQTGQVVQQGLARDGSIWTLNPPPEAVRLAYFVPETGHNIPQVFFNYMLSAGKVYDNGYKEASLRDWVFTMGYPLSEPYWIKAMVGGVEREVLVQVFERRILTYTPSNQPEWRVEMANVGQHYYLWRYGRNLYDE